MKAILPFLVCITALAQSPPATPQNLRLVSEATATTIALTTIAGSGGPLAIAHQGWAAYWQLPDSINIWVPEYSIDGGLSWSRCLNQWSGGEPFGNWNYTETGTNWTFPYPVQMSQWLVRIRNIGPVPPLPPPSTNVGFSTFAILPPRSVRCPTCPLAMATVVAGKVMVPPLPLRMKPARTAASSLGVILTPIAIIDPNCQCPLLQVSFLAQTNFIYSFQRSYDLRNWELRPPEIDGDAGINAFYDVFDGAAMYRVVSRPGVLPP